ncbi:MAG: alpha/beta hydrolase family protein [Pyrinomonadaceae bacterium]
MSCHAQSVSTVQVQTISFKSNLVGATLPYIVVLPAGYQERSAGTQASYPVLYLLHGLGGRYDNWTSKTKLKEYAAQYQMIIVTPEGNDGWYTDSATVATDKYETYIMEELIPDVERRFRAAKGREGRAIAGLSMGGYGALKFAVKYPDRFVFAASISGALDPAERSDANQGFAWGFLRSSVLKTFGPDNSATRASNNLHKIFRELASERIRALPYIYLDCGTEDGFFATNHDLASILLERKIPHEYRQLPGKHDWVYWDQQLREVLKLAAQEMAKH